MIALLALGTSAAAYKLYERGNVLSGGLIITGRTPSVSTKPPALRTIPPNSGPPNAVPVVPAPPVNADTPKPPAEVVVHVAGAVRKPGLYRLSLGARVDDALKAAGGAKAEANLDAVNLAARAEDGTQLYVPTRSEQPQGGASASIAPPPTVSHNAHTSVSRASSHAEKLTSPGQGTVNINAATAEDLQKLPGVGPSYALRILQFRKDNGPFTNPEQLMDVSGIGEKKFEKMRPFVRIH
jgi:competence protein ComEA